MQTGAMDFSLESNRHPVIWARLWHFVDCKNNNKKQRLASPLRRRVTAGSGEVMTCGPAEGVAKMHYMSFDGDLRADIDE